MGQVHFHLLPKGDDQAAYDALMRSHFGRAEGRHLAAVGTEWGKDAMHALTKDGGFTLHDHVGDGPKDGYMVSLNKDTEEVHDLSEFQREHLAAFRERHAQELADPRSYLGGWVHEGKVYLDVSHHEPDLNKAMDLARQHKQLGIYDVAGSRTVMTDQQQGQQSAAALHLLPDDDDLAVAILRSAGDSEPMRHLRLL
jgi:hypothetical protein